jgi:hypothetical protein
MVVCVERTSIASWYSRPPLYIMKHLGDHNQCWCCMVTVQVAPVSCPPNPLQLASPRVPCSRFSEALTWSLSFTLRLAIASCYNSDAAGLESAPDSLIRGADILRLVSDKNT